MTTEDSTKDPPGTRLAKLRRKLPVLLVLPYVVGIAWHAAHPLVEVFTGKTVPRRWYIDENSLEPAYLRMDFRYDLVRKKKRSPGINSLCSALEPEDSDSISCVQYGAQLEVARILPTIPVTPTAEALVVVVKSSSDWASSQFHASVLQLIRRLSIAPWLAKTVLIVSSDTLSLSGTVDKFLDLYLGSRDGSWRGFSEGRSLPFSGAMLRNLIVLDVETSRTNGKEVRILPQGRRGVLPNMDITFLGKVVFSSATKSGVMVMHPHQSRGQELYRKMLSHLPTEMHEWANKFLEFFLFEYTLLMGPYPPHAGALDRGIDAITIQGILPEDDKTLTDTAQFVQRMEPTLRALSNLHERLHHSSSLYLIVSPDRFVKHEEYLVPNLLLIIPLVIRAVFLVVMDISRFDWKAVGWALQWTVVATLTCAVGLGKVAGNDPWTMFDGGLSIMLFALVYLFILIQSRLQRFTVESVQSIQFLACMLGIVVNVPLAFGHVSLSFPSALVWTPLIAFSSYQQESSKKAFRVLSALFWLAVLVTTWPCTFLVPNVFPTFSVYVRYGYLPLHLIVTLLQLSRISSPTS